MKAMNYSYSGNKPELVQKIGSAYQINFDTLEETVSGAGGQGRYTQFKSVCASSESLGYGDLVSAIIGAKYSTSDTEAVILNRQLASEASGTLPPAKKEEYIKEYQQLQEWRAHAKEVAKKCLE